VADFVLCFYDMDAGNDNPAGGQYLTEKLSICGFDEYVHQVRIGFDVILF